MKEKKKKIGYEFRGGARGGRAVKVREFSDLVPVRVLPSSFFILFVLLIFYFSVVFFIKLNFIV
jgi:hypothetical protein